MRGPPKIFWIFILFLCCPRIYILWPIWNYISENISEQELGPSNRLFTKEENYIGAGAINQWRHLHREWGTSVQPLKKLTANGNKYSRGGTAELKPYWITGNHGFTKTIRGPRKVPQKLFNIFLFLRYFITFTAQKMAMAIGNQRSIEKIPKPVEVLS